VGAEPEVTVEAVEPEVSDDSFGSFEEAEIDDTETPPPPPPVTAPVATKTVECDELKRPLTALKKSAHFIPEENLTRISDHLLTKVALQEEPDEIFLQDFKNSLLD
jgi:hypothetical protein